MNLSRGSNQFGKSTQDKKAKRNKTNRIKPRSNMSCKGFVSRDTNRNEPAHMFVPLSCGVMNFVRPPPFDNLAVPCSLETVTSRNLAGVRPFQGFDESYSYFYDDDLEGDDVVLDGIPLSNMDHVSNVKSEMRACFLKLLKMVPLNSNDTELAPKSLINAAAGDEDLVVSGVDPTALEVLIAPSWTNKLPSVFKPANTDFSLSSTPVPSTTVRKVSKLQLLQGAIDYILDLESSLENKSALFGRKNDPSNMISRNGDPPYLFPSPICQMGITLTPSGLDFDRQIYGMPPSR